MEIDQAAGVRSTRVPYGDVIERRAVEQPDKVFMWIDDEEFTYAELRRRFRMSAHGLLAAGVARGDTVASFTRTCFDTVSLIFAAPAVGAMFMPINTAYKGDYLVHQLRDSRTRVILVDDALLHEVAAVVDELPDVHTVLVRSASRVEASAIGHVAVRDARTLVEADPDAPIAATPTAWNEPSYLFYTSGTTGPSKGALITQNYLASLCQVYLRRYGFRPTDVQYLATPLFHGSGAYNAVITTLLGGHSTALDSGFHVSTCWERVRKFGADIYFGVGATTMMLWNLPADPADADLPFRLLISAPIPAEIWRALEQRYRCEALQGYGLTEGIMLACMESGGENTPGSSGKPIELYDVRVVDDNDDDAPLGEPGEIVFRPTRPHVMFEGYVNRPDATLGQMKNLWFHTGDLGKFDADGNLWFLDRKKDHLRRRGENISSFEVEASLRRHPAVAECAAYAVPSELGEDDVMVALVLRADVTFDFDEFREHCARTMPRFAIPRYVDILDELPKSITGRLQKHVLRANGVSADTWDYDLGGTVGGERVAS